MSALKSSRAKPAKKGGKKAVSHASLHRAATGSYRKSKDD